MYKLNSKKRAWIIKQYLKGASPSKLAVAQRVHRSAVYQILDRYKQFDWEGGEELEAEVKGKKLIIEKD